MATDWRSFLGGMAGSAGVHLLGALWLIAAIFGGPIREPGWNTLGDPYAFDVASHDPSFALAPLVFDQGRMFTIDARDCGGRSRDRAPRLLGSGTFEESRRMPREPRLCVRVEPDGSVTSARVLLSSGDRATDAAVEAHARALRFEAVRPGAPAVATTVTLNVTAGSKPARVTIPAEGPGMPLL